MDYKISSLEVGYVLMRVKESWPSKKSYFYFYFSPKEFQNTPNYVTQTYEASKEYYSAIRCNPAVSWDVKFPTGEWQKMACFEFRRIRP